MITAMGVRCIIIDPLDEDSPLERGSHKIRGLAWSGEGGITRVEVSLDGGKTWRDAHIEEPHERWLWVRWSYLWEVGQPGSYRIMARATDETGRGSRGCRGIISAKKTTSCRRTSPLFDLKP